MSFWGAGSDSGAYLTLAHNLATHAGLSFSGTPTAFRPPLYPLILAGTILLAPAHFLILVRLLQFGATLVTAWACGEMADLLGGSRLDAAALALWMPTLLFFQPEIITETFAVMLTALWFACWLRNDREVVLGGTAGILALLRFNSVPLVALGPALLLYRRQWRAAAVSASVGLVILSPWLMRNWMTFGAPIYSTHTGFALVEGIVSPLGRTQPGETEALVRTLGWTQQSIETNAARGVRDEIALNRKATHIALSRWREMPHSWGVKLAAFWLSYDQWSDTGGLSQRAKAVRRLGVLFYWFVLALAVVGVARNIRQMWPLLAFAIILTAMHLPLTMNTRLRVPLMEPLLIAAACCAKPRAWTVELVPDSGPLRPRYCRWPAQGRP